MWIKKYINDEFLKGSNIIETTFGDKKKIKEADACFVFRPEKRRGDNGVNLQEFLGIADLSEMTLKFDKGMDMDIALYPIGIPRNSLKVHNEFSTMMIGGIWRKYRTVEPE